MDTESNKFRLASWFTFAGLVLVLTAGPAMALRALHPGGNTIAGPGLFKGRRGDFADVYQAQSIQAVCVTLRVVRGTTSLLTDGTVPALMARAGTTISGCGDASVVTISCDTKCKAEWRVDGQGNMVIENIDVQAAQVQVVGVVGPTGPPGDTGSAGPAGPTGSPGPAGPQATPADSVCADNTNRYVDCVNGTVTDTVTGLIWLKKADCFALSDWVSAINSAAQLKAGDCELSDGSKPGDWRLPTRAEWVATVAPAVAGSCPLPTLTNRAGTACYASDGAFSGVQSFYWSSSTDATSPSVGWNVDLGSGHTSELSKDVVSSFVWPVRGGQ